MTVNILVIIPAFNEQESIGSVVRDIPRDLVDEIVVVNNSSTDKTEEEAKREGATVLREPRRGYGSACLRGIAYAKTKDPRPDIIVFIDGDYSDHPEQMPRLVAPIVDDAYDLVIGSRALGQRERGAMTPQQVFGNWLATTLIRRFYHVRFTDLGPFRAIRFDKLLALEMVDQTFGWTVEMQLKAAKQGLRCTEVAVDYRKRIGFSKISGTVGGTVRAGYKIIHTIFRYL
ncbi:MAG: glycosyltransferase family 2 protein [Proteobacteria bacterium]|jgi:glycosyltransferase involved in cell wall biosynthesis|nr:glycosyltransferase family 2 protein [Pseudomonadota bacterium]